MSGNNSIQADVTFFEETMTNNQRDLRQAEHDTEDLKQDLSNFSSKYSYDIDELFKDNLDIVQSMMNDFMEYEETQQATDDHTQK